jgi:hypothetical protein
VSDNPKPTPPASGGGAATAGGTVKPCTCGTDFTITARCRILKKGGNAVQITAAESPGCAGGTFAWQTSSAGLGLASANSPTVSVRGLSVSSGRDAETLKCTRTQPGCPSVVKTVNLTVAEVTFLKSNNQRYGFDDFDTAANHDDDHLSIKRADYTLVRVKIDGGATSDDFDFTSAAAGTAAPAAAPAGQTDFDLRVDGGATDKATTKLRAVVKCPSAEVFRELDAHTYKERLVKVVIGKFFDSTQAGTTLNHPTADYTGREATINASAKEGVVQYDMQNLDAANAASDVRFDLDGDGALSYDINGGGGTEFNKINAAFSGARTAGRIRVAIIKSMKSYYYLSAAASVGDTTITIRGSSFFDPRRAMPLGTGANQENVTVSSAAGGTLTLASALTKAHAVGTTLEFPATGWGSDPIVVQELTDTVNAIAGTIAHEAGHRPAGLSLVDINDIQNIMHHARGRTDYRLRYCPRTKQYGGGTENQWETIPRT